MKKIIFLIISTALYFCISGCAGYKPIFGSSNFNFKIENHTIKGDERLSNLIYKKLRNISLSNKDNPSAQSINLIIETTKEKKPRVKNSAGKILEYEINIKTYFIMDDYLTDKIILKKNFSYSISYKVQEAHSETIKLEKKNIESLIDKTYQDILIKISESLSMQ